MTVQKKALSSEEILENIPHSILTADLEGCVTYWNKASERIFGYKKEEMLGQSFEKVYSDENRDQFWKDLEHLRQGKEVRGTRNCLRKDDTTRWIDVYAKALFDEEGAFITIVASVTDISNLIKVERELRISEAKVEAVFKSAIDGIVSLDKDGSIRRFNEAASKIFGYTEDEVRGRSYRLLLPEKDRESRENYFREMLQDKKQEFTGKRKELTGRKKDGLLFPMEVAINKMSWRETEIFTAFINDISERRRLEKEILLISEEERQKIGQEMHDGLGQLLSGIGLMAQTLARKLEPINKTEASEAKKIARLIKKADEQARALAHGLVNVGIEEDGLQMSLKRLCKQIKTLFNINCIHDIDFNITINNNVIALNLFRIAQEAINNAHKHGKAGNIHISLHKDNDSIVLSVENDGKPFSEPRGEEKKEGMGIHIMKYRSKMMYGHLEFKQTEDEHTVVVCKVPSDQCEMAAT